MVPNHARYQLRYTRMIQPIYYIFFLPACQVEYYKKSGNSLKTHWTA